MKSSNSDDDRNDMESKLLRQAIEEEKARKRIRGPYKVIQIYCFCTWL